MWQMNIKWMGEKNYDIKCSTWTNLDKYKMGLGGYQVGQILTIIYNRWELHEPYLGKLIIGGFCWDKQIIINMSWNFPKTPSMWYTLCVNEIFILHNSLALKHWKKWYLANIDLPNNSHKKYSQKTPNLEMVSLSTTTKLNMITI
jgi:hypothetical protein